MWLLMATGTVLVTIGSWSVRIANVIIHFNFTGVKAYREIEACTSSTFFITRFLLAVTLITKLNQTKDAFRPHELSTQALVEMSLCKIAWRKNLDLCVFNA